MLYGEKELKQLYGGKISSFSFSDQSFTLNIGDKKLLVMCEGDCCSTSWFESIEGTDALDGSRFNTLIKIEAIDMADIKVEKQLNPGLHDSVQFYGLKITTSLGYCILEMRNDSNGYYGGNFNFTIEAQTPPSAPSPL